MLGYARVRVRGLGQTLRRVAKRSPLIVKVYRRVADQSQRVRLGVDRVRGKLAGDAGGGRGANPRNMVWIFGSGRSGSTWLRSMMGEMRDHRIWEEPMVGRLFGEFYARSPKENLRSRHFIMGEPIRRGWIKSVRNFVLDGAENSNPGLDAGEYLVVKEPNGSVGAPLLMEALPESRMIFLIRDPRDVVASVLDAARKGGWLYERWDEDTARRRRTAEKRPKVFVGKRAWAYRRGMENARRAYEAHEGPKVLVRYEELRADALGTMRRIYATLGIPADEGELVRAVEEHAWENVAEDRKGEGKFHRKAKPGGWREDLTPEQAAEVEKVTAPLLEEFYPGWERAQNV